MISLRPRQLQAIADTRAAIAKGKRAPIIVCATGGGKTLIASGIIQGVIAKGKKALFLAHRQELIDSAHDKLRAFGIESGIIKAGRGMALVYPVQVASVQTLVRRMDRLAFRPDVVLIDESHLSNAQTYKKIVEFYGNPILVGLSATPQRLSGDGLGIGHGGMFDCFIPAGTTRELIDEGFLCPFKYYAPPRLFDTAGIKTIAGELDQHELEERTDRPTITGDFLAHWNRLAKGLPTMVFAVGVKHAEHIAEQARAQGIRAVAVNGKSDDSLRSQALKNVQSGAIDMIVNVGLFVEGLDCPALACLGDLAFTKSITRYRQKIGRVLRTHPGKPHAIILDHVGNVEKHGLPDMPVQWSLEGRKKSKKEKPIAIRQCPQCFVAHTPAPVCPECGWVYVAAPRSGPEEVAGELVEITQEQVAEARHVQRREESRAATLEDWQRIAAARGYRSQWATIRYGLRQKRA